MEDNKNGQADLTAGSVSISYIVLEGSDCNMCLEDLGGSSVTLVCGYTFQDACIMPWLDRHDSCPYCRYTIISKITV